MATLEELGLQTRTQKTNGLDKLHRLGIGYINEELDRAPEPDYSFVPTPQKESPEDFSAIPLPQQKVKLQQRKDDTAEKVREYYSAPPTRFDKIIMGSDAAEMVFGDLATFGEIQPDTEERLNVLQKSGAKAAGSAWDLLLDGIGYASALAGRDDSAKNISEVKKRNLAPARLPSSRKEFDVSDLTKPDFWAEQAPATIALYLAGSTGGAIGGSAAASLAARAGLTEKAAQVAKFAGQIFGGTIPMTGAEAFMEASGTYNQALESMLQSGKSEKEAQEKASEVAANTFTSNLALLAGTNAFEYYTALGKLPRGVRNKFTRYVIDRAKGAGIQKGGRRAVFGALNIASKGAAAAAESAEEVIQGWVQKTAQDYVDGTKPDAGLEIKDLLTKIEEMKPDTQAEILVGLGMGLLFQAGGSFEEYSARRKKLERKAKTNPQELKRDIEKIVTEEEETKQAFSIPAQEQPAAVEPDKDEKALNEIAQQAYGKSLDDLPIEQRTDLEKRYVALSEKAAKKKIDDLISERVGLKKAKAVKPEKEKAQPPVSEAAATASTAEERIAPDFVYQSEESKEWWEKLDELKIAYEKTKPHTEERRSAREKLNLHEDVGLKSPNLRSHRVDRNNPLRSVLVTSSSEGSPFSTYDISDWIFTGQNGVNKNGKHWRLIQSKDGKEILYVFEDKLHELEIESLQKNTDNFVPVVKTEPSPHENVKTEQLPKGKKATREDVIESFAMGFKNKKGTAPAAEPVALKPEVVTPKTESSPSQKAVAPSPVSARAGEEPQPSKTAVIDKPLSEIATDTDRFQNRATDFSEKTAATVAERFDPNLFDPIVLWKDPQNGNDYVLSGHSRFEGMKRRGEKNIPSRYFQGTEAEAMNFAKVEANRLGSAENLQETLKAYKQAKQGNATKAKLKDLFDGDVDFLESAQNLSESGDFIRYLGQGAATEFPYIKRFSRWVGELRKTYGGKLTDRHEQQVFDWLYKGEKRNREIEKDRFFDIIEKQVSRTDFNPNAPLQLKRGEPHKIGTRGRADTSKLESELDQLRADKKNARTPAEAQAIDKEIARVESTIKTLVKTQPDLFGEAVARPVPPASSAPTHADFDRALKTFQEVAAKQTGKPVTEQSAAIAEELRLQKVHQVIIDELTNPRRAPKPRDPESERSATSRPERIARASKPSPTLKPKVDAVAQASVDFRNKEAALLKAREEIKADIEARGGEVVVDTDTGAMTITLKPGKAKISDADQALIEKLRKEAAEAGAYSLVTVGQGFEVSATPERIAESKSLPTGDFKARALEFLKRNADAKAAEKVFKQEKEDARNDLVDYYLAERAAGKETPSALLGLAKDGTKVEVMARRVRSAAEPDLAVGGRDFPKEIAEAKKQAKERATETGEPFIETRKAGEKKITQAKERGAFVAEQSEGYQPNRTIDKAKNPIFYSQLLQVVSNKLPNSGTAEQMLQAIDAFQKKGEFKKEEIEWVGLREWLQGKSGKVAKQEITDFVKEHQIEVRFIRPDKPKYKKHVLDGGRKYQEVLFVLPGIKGDEFKQFHSSNFEADEPIVAHVRLDERDTADGGRALFIEEIQSDWHQKGRERGYLEIPKGWKINKVDPNKNRYKVIADSEDNNKNLRKVTLIDIDEDNVSVTRRDAFRGSDEDAFKVLFSDLRSYQIINPDGKIEDTITGTRFNDIESLAVQAAIDISNGDEIGGKGVPNAPFKTTWHELAFKRMLRYAVDKGFDKIAWTTGEHQSERYDLSKRVSGIIWNTKTRNLYVKGTNGESIIDIEAVTDSELSDLVGKEMSNKILSGEPNEKGYVKFYGDDLSIGGEGMKGFYNKIIPEFVKKYTKKWGGEVSQTEIQTGEDEYATVHSLDITNAMRESVSKGQVLFESPAPYEPNYKKRPDVTPRTDRLAKEFMDALGKNRRRGRVYLANAIDASARENGQINLNGQRVRTTDDLAVVGQVARDPRVEQLRYVLVKDGKVIGSYMVGSRLPSATAAFPYASTKEGIGWLNGLMKDTGADGYYMLHNHPSGEVDTSGKEDLDVTETVSSRVEGFKGHVVIDSNVYATITRGKDGSLKKQVKQKFFGEDKLLKPSIDNPLIGRKAEDSNDLMAIGKAVQTPEGWATIIGTTPDSRIRGIAEVEEALLQIKGKRRAAIIRKFARDTGSAEVFLVADQKFFDANKDTLKKAVELGFIRDAVSSNGESIASQFPNLRKSNVFFGKEIEAGRLVKEGAQEIPDTITVNGKERQTRNSKGQLIHGTREGIENFWKWFWDSKVVDEQGRPLVVYHGTTARSNFDTFDPEGRENAWVAEYPEGAMFFSSSPENASYYGGTIYPLYLNIENPLSANVKKSTPESILDTKTDIWNRYFNQSKDGIIVSGQDRFDKKYSVYVVFEPTQIKSAIGNRGTFSPEEPSIVRESESTYGKAGLNREQFLDLGVKLNDFLQDKENVDKLTEAERKEFAVILGVLKEYIELSKKADLSQKEQRLLRIALSGLESKDGKRIISSVQKALEEGKPGWRDAINSSLEKIAEWSGAMKLWRLSSVAGSAGGNLFSSMLYYPESRLSAWFNKGIAKRSNVALTRFSDEARIHFKAAWMSGEIKNAAQQAIDIMKEKPGAESESKFLEREHIQKKAIKGWYGKYIRASYNAQGAIDVLYRKPLEVGFIAVESFREGMKDSETKIEGAKKGNVVARNILRVRELRDAGKEIPKSLEKYAKILQKAESDAEYRVFQSQLTGIAKKLGDFRRYPVVRILAPFYNTGMNILKQAYERTPLSAFQKEFMQLSEKHLKKTLTAEEAGRYSDRAAQITLGTLVSLVTTALLYAIADDDEELITGNYDPQTIGDKPLGWQPNSIRIGDTYVSTKMLQPYATIFTAIGETMNNKEGYLAGGAKALADAYFVNPMTEEVFDVISAIRPGENKPLTKSAEEFFVDLVVGSATPGILNDIAKITDPVVRQKHGFFGRLRGKVGIPGASLSLPPRIDPFGEDLIPQTRGEKTVKTLTGLSFSKNKEDAARKELRSLGLNHDVESVTHKGVKLEPWEAIELNKSIGQRYREKILNLLQNPYYLSASVESRKKKLRMIRQGLIDKQKKYLERDPFFIERERSVRELKEAEKRLFKQMPE